MAPDPSLAIAFGAGLASFLTPCVLPVLPGFLAVAAGGPEAATRSRVGRSLAFVLGFGAVFVALGLAVGAVAASSSSRLLGTVLERVGGALIILFGLHLTGLLRLPLLDRTARLDVAGPGEADADGGRGVAFSAVLGAAFGVGWTPCVGPVLASVLVVLGVFVFTGSLARALSYVRVW